LREIKAEVISDEVARICEEANLYLGKDVEHALKDSINKEESPTGKAVLEQLDENINIARNEEIPICQDTGYAVFFVEWGQDAQLTGGSLQEAIDEGVRRGYDKGYLRKSIVKDPLQRTNTGDNTPSVVNLAMVPGDKIKIAFAPKGGGSENMSIVKMLKPSDGYEGVVDFVVNHVKEAGPNPCPPIVVGVGIGGTFERSALLAKKALIREVGKPNPESFYAEMEKEMLEKVNDLGIGPQGFGGRVTALAVHVETYPCHIASLPVAVNINCHANRHAEVVI